MTSSRVSACGILFCYNEEHILQETLKHYVSQGIDLVIIDNNSTDSSPDIINSFRNKNGSYPGRIQDVVNVKTDGYEWRKILRFACEYMHEKLSHYEWIFLIDADAFYYSPVKNISLMEFMTFAKSQGCNIINGTVHEFYPTEKDNLSIASPIERMKYYRILPEIIEHKIFLYHPTIDFHTYYGHICLRDNPIVFFVGFLYCHYPWISYEHGLKKIFGQRMPRYHAERMGLALELGGFSHFHYCGILPIKKDLVKDSKKLQYCKAGGLSISHFRFLCILKFKTFIEKYTALRKIAIRELKVPAQRFCTVFLYDKKLAGRNFIIFIKSAIKRVARKIFKIKSKTNPANNKTLGVFVFRLPNFVEVLRQEPSVFWMPRYYHFLMTNYCNVKCVFCNQEFGNEPKEITLDAFKIMLSNIPTNLENSFYFSGGGEPLLCRDLFSIIDHLDNNFPWIKKGIITNGVLIKKYVKELAQSNIHELIISVHGATEKTYDTILQSNRSKDVFEGLLELNKRLECCNSDMRKIFNVGVSRSNIDELPELVRKASELKIDELRVDFWRYFPKKIYYVKEAASANQGSSLFFDKKKYNDIILRSKKIAGSLGVRFQHEPLFFDRFKKRPCLQPWMTILIDWDGTIYPCTGGEVWFSKKVKSGNYDFGNLLREHLSECWNNTSYTMIRRTCSRFHKENFIPECENCHNTICLKGPDLKNGHILLAH